MERDNYNLRNQQCAQSLSGPVCKCFKTKFLGDNIYTTKLRNIDNCNERHTYVDCKGNVKFTLPLDAYKNLSKLDEKICNHHSRCI